MPAQTGLLPAAGLPGNAAAPAGAVSASSPGAVKGLSYAPQGVPDTVAPASQEVTGDPAAGDRGPAVFQALLDSQKLKGELPEALWRAGTVPARNGEDTAAEPGRFWLPGGNFLPQSGGFQEASDALALERAVDAADGLPAGLDVPMPVVFTSGPVSPERNAVRGGSLEAGSVLPLAAGETRSQAASLQARLDAGLAAGNDNKDAAPEQLVTALLHNARGGEGADPALMARGESRSRLDLLMESGLTTTTGDTTTAQQSQQAIAPATLWQQPLPASSDRAPVALMLQAPLQHQAQWGEEMGQQVKWLVSQKLHAAELKLNPPQLGAIEVRVVVQQDQVNLHFVSPHAQVREAIEESLPRLREILQGNGFNLVDVDVSQQDSTGRRDRAETDAGSSGGGLPGSVADAGEDEVSSLSPPVRRGLVDFYA